MYYSVIDTTSTVCVRLPEGMVDQLEDIAGTADRPKSYLIRKAIEQYLAEYADYRIALDRLNDKDDGIVSPAEMRKRLAGKD